MTDVSLLLVAALLGLVSLLTASILRTRSWTREGRILGLGNREQLPEPSPIAGRADRAAKNLLESLPLFACVMLAAHLAGASPGPVTFGAHLFVWSRVVYWLVYLAGVRYVRTVVWLSSIAGMAVIAGAALH